MNVYKKYKWFGQPTTGLRILGIVVSLVVVGAGWLAAPDAYAGDTRSIIFPVLGGGRYSNDFGDPRSGGRTHQGNDIFGLKHQPLVAAVDGHVRFVSWPQPAYGYMVSITDEEGYQYWYLHINNDTPGTDDGKGGGRNAYAPSIDDGAPVVKGQIIGYLGDSGNAESTTPHLHFEVHRPDGTPINPFPTLNIAQRISRAVMTPPLPDEIVPYGEFKGGASVAFGELSLDSTGDEIVTGAGSGGGPLVRIFDEFKNPLGGFYAYDKTFIGGVDVTVGDINGDGTNEIITAPGIGGGPYIRAFTLKGELLAEFLAYKDTFRGGVHLSADDLDGDGVAEIVTVPKSGAAVDVRVYHATGERLGQWVAYPGFKKGGDVATVAAAATDPGRIITSPLRGGGPDVRVYSPSGLLSHGFFAYDSNFHGGVRISAERQADGSIQIATIPFSGAGSHVRRWNEFGTEIKSEFLFEQWWSGGYDVALSQTRVAASTAPGGRRASVKTSDINVAPPDSVDNGFDWWGGFGD